MGQEAEGKVFAARTLHEPALLGSFKMLMSRLMTSGLVLGWTCLVRQL